MIYLKQQGGAMKEWVRHCISCRREILVCNGLVIPRDFVAFMEGRRAPEHVRELCGSCGLILSTKPSGEKKSYEEFMETLERVLSENPLPPPWEFRETPIAA